MRVLRKMLFPILIVVGICLIVICALSLLTSDYLHFMGKDRQYYSDLARACDLVLERHPLGTNATSVPVVGSDVPYVFIRIPGDDPLLPQVIRDLDPEHVTVSSNRVHIVVGVGRGAFGIAWEPRDGPHWGIVTYAESLERVAYVEAR